MLIWILLLTSIPPTSSFETTGPIDYCYYETFEGSCEDGNVLLILNASYGRINFGRCLKRNFGYMGCYSHVTSHLNRKCFGKQGCAVKVVESNFAHTKGCNQEVKSFLRIEYLCVKENTISHDCHYRLDSGVSMVTFPVSMTTISVSMTTEKNNIMQKCNKEKTWVVEAEVGQRLNVTMVMLSGQSEERMKRRSKGRGRRSEESAMTRDELIKMSREDTDCFGLLVEPASSMTSLICGGNEVGHMITSQSNRLEVFVEEEGVEFVLLFEVLGCPDLKLDDATVTYDAEKSRAEVRCLLRHQSVMITCEDNQWMGLEEITCQGKDLLYSRHSGSTRDLRMTSVMVAMLVTIISCIISIIVLTTGLLLFKRFKLRRYDDSSQVLTSQNEVNSVQPISKQVNKHTKEIFSLSSPGCHADQPVYCDGCLATTMPSTLSNLDLTLLPSPPPHHV